MYCEVYEEVLFCVEILVVSLEFGVQWEFLMSKI